MKTGVAGLKSIKSAKKSLDRFIRDSGTIQDQELDVLVAEAYPKMLAMTPYKTGKLESGVYCRRSHSIRNRGVVAGAVAMSNRYNYAPKQHEDTTLNHPIKGEAHFISEPLQDAIASYMRRVKERMRQSWST